MGTKSTPYQFIFKLLPDTLRSRVSNFHGNNIKIVMSVNGQICKKVELCKNTIVNELFTVPAVGTWQAPSVRFLLVLWT